MKEKKTVPAAAVTPVMPAKPLLLSVLKKGKKLSALNPENAMTTKNTRIASLMMTMMAFIRADSLAPRSSKKPHMQIKKIGGRLMWPA